jgi:hypothetical protein
MSEVFSNLTHHFLIFCTFLALFNIKKCKEKIIIALAAVINFLGLIRLQVDRCFHFGN